MPCDLGHALPPSGLGVFISETGVASKLLLPALGHVGLGWNTVTWEVTFELGVGGTKDRGDTKDAPVAPSDGAPRPRQSSAQHQHSAIPTKLLLDGLGQGRGPLTHCHLSAPFAPGTNEL